ncbi:hypothetical protein CDD83_5839 [Cordyceps sp. RAO-2017]|nr:hypothetical protein CDD83_5839 [Cordyceps sp. RAO-2017]
MQQYFEVAKLLTSLLPLGIKCNTSSTFSDGEFKSRQNKWWVGLEHALHKNFLMIGQPIVEKLLSAKLESQVHYGERVVSLSEGKEHVDILTDSGRRLRCRYAVGADGARSTVRKEMGLAFTGTKPEMLWAVLDAFIDTDFPVCPEIITFQLDGQSRVSWIPRERGMSRFYVLLDGEVTQERAQESIKRHMAPHRVEFKKIEWYSTFDVKERIASSFVSKGGAGRVILAGDAAHVHSVNGGQGLNTGIADAFNLAWRLAEVVMRQNLKASTAEKLIRSYDTERRGTAQGVIDVAAALVRDTVREAKTYVGMGVSYDTFHSPLVWKSEHGIFQAGFRCPDVVLESLDGEKGTRLYTEITYGKFLVLFVGNHDQVEFGHKEIATPYHILPLAGKLNTAQTNGNMAAQDSGSPMPQEATVVKFRANWVDPDDSFVVVVRPDMYIGYVHLDAQSCKPYLDDLYS